MQIHVLPGDSLLKPFEETNIEGEKVVCRECLIDGDVYAENLDAFWRIREDYLNSAYPKEPGFYRDSVKSEFEKLLRLPDESEVNLWFEYELFCQVNLWFCIWLLHGKKLDLYRVAPIIKNENDVWKGFGALDSNELAECFSRRIKLTGEEVQLGQQLWKAFSFKDFEGLTTLSETKFECYPYLKEVCDAETEKKSRPKATLEKIITRGETDFVRIFRAFSETEGVYGFGDEQVRRIYDNL